MILGDARLARLDPGTRATGSFVCHLANKTTSVCSQRSRERESEREREREKARAAGNRGTSETARVLPRVPSDRRYFRHNNNPGSPSLPSIRLPANGQSLTFHRRSVEGHWYRLRFSDPRFEKSMQPNRHGRRLLSLIPFAAEEHDRSFSLLSLLRR